MNPEANEVTGHKHKVNLQALIRSLIEVNKVNLGTGGQSRTNQAVWLDTHYLSRKLEFSPFPYSSENLFFVCLLLSECFGPLTKTACVSIQKLPYYAQKMVRHISSEVFVFLYLPVLCLGKWLFLFSKDFRHWFVSEKSLYFYRQRNDKLNCWDNENPIFKLLGRNSTALKERTTNDLYLHLKYRHLTLKLPLSVLAMYSN